jgi:co-chaperonin GroES (HSP10)
MIKPRNSLAVLRLLEKAEQQVGKIVVSDVEELYTEAEVMAVGPGSISAEGGRSEMFDLAVGQRVMVKHKEFGPQRMKVTAGIKYIHNDEVLYVFEQSSIVGIIAEPGNAPASEPQTKTGEKPKVLLA